MNRAGAITCKMRAPSAPGWRRFARPIGVVLLLYAFALSGLLAGTLLATPPGACAG